MQSKLYRDGHRFFLNDDQLADLKRLQVPRITPSDDGGVRTTTISFARWCRVHAYAGTSAPDSG